MTLPLVRTGIKADDGSSIKIKRLLFERNSEPYLQAARAVQHNRQRGTEIEGRDKLQVLLRGIRLLL